MFSTVKTCGLYLIPLVLENKIKNEKSSDEIKSDPLGKVKFDRNCIYASTSILLIATLCLLKTAAKSTANYVCKGLIALSAASDLYFMYCLYEKVKRLQEEANLEIKRVG